MCKFGESGLYDWVNVGIVYITPCSLYFMFGLNSIGTKVEPAQRLIGKPTKAASSLALRQHLMVVWLDKVRTSQSLLKLLLSTH